MKLKSGIVVVLLVIAMLVIVPTVSAYVLLEDFTVPNAGTGKYMGASFRYYNGLALNANLTRVTYDWPSTCPYFVDLTYPTGTDEKIYFIGGGVLRGNGTMSWTVDNPQPNYVYDVMYDIKISDLKLPAGGGTFEVRMNSTGQVFNDYISAHAHNYFCHNSSADGNAPSTINIVHMYTGVGSAGGYPGHYILETGPQDYIYSNITVNVKSNTTGLNVPRADVTLHQSLTASISGKTDSEGNITFGLFPNWPYPLYFNVTKAGYKPASAPFTGDFANAEISQNFVLDDIDIVPGEAVVVLDIADADTGAAITGATVGIQNTTATIDQWTYGTYAESTILFNKTGVTPAINLSVGQNIAFAGYKSGVYEANNTGTYQIPSPISHLELLLKKVVGNTSAQYHYPVTITDATTGNAIGDSTLKTAFWSGGIHSNYYNSTSATGKFNVTGVGTGGQTPLKSGDIVLLYGNATGYEPSGFYLTVDDETNGVTQYVNLAPSSLVPLSGEFTALVEAYDADTTQALQGVSVVVRKGGNSTSATTGASGIAKFKNLTAGDSYSLTATKTGYTQLTKTFMGGSGLIVTIDAAMSSVGVNPTYSITTTPTSNASAGAMNEKGAAGLTQWIDYLIMVSGLVFVGLIILFGAKVVRAVRDALGI